MDKVQWLNIHPEIYNMYPEEKHFLIRTKKALKLRCEGFSLPTTTKGMLLKLLALKDIRSRPGLSVSDLEQLCLDNGILERSEKKLSKKVLMIAMLSLYNERHQPVK